MPTWFSDEDTTNLTFNAKAQEAMVYSWLYYASPAPLGGANETNFLTDKFPTLLRKACLYIAAEFERIWEDRDRYLADAERELKRATRKNNLRRNRMGRTPVVR